MKIVLGQIGVIASDLEGNYLKIKTAVERAVAEKADLIVFPEHVITGSFVGDLLLKESFIKKTLSYNDKLAELSKDIGIIWGNFYRVNNTLYNAAFFFDKGKPVKHLEKAIDGVCLKENIADSRYFNESRYVNKNETISNSPFKYKKDNKDVLINLYISDDFFKIQDTKISESLSEINIIISASPYTINSKEEIHKALLKRSSKTLVFVNNVGVANSGKPVVIYQGNSGVYFNHQHVSESLEDFNEGLIIFNTNKVIVTNDDNDDKNLLKPLVYALQGFDKQILGGKANWIIGLSGGLDSSVVVGLLVIAFGKERIYSYNLPSKINSEITKNNAKHIANVLGLNYKTLPISTIISETKKQFVDVSIAVEENIHARMRANLLMTAAQIHNGVVVNNGNKVEAALGYATLYGDAIGAISPIGDLTKIQVGQLAKEINAYFKKDVIPQVIIPNDKDGVPTFGFAPSAELKDNQFDPMKWGYHDYLVEFILNGNSFEDFILLYKNNSLPANINVLIKHYGLDDENKFIDDLNWFASAWNSAVFKRLQSAPIISISNSTFGSDYLEAQLIKKQYKL